jgi:HPt (histidine-containing phosphotransfer) domain-containing protein
MSADRRCIDETILRQLHVEAGGEALEAILAIVETQLDDLRAELSATIAQNDRNSIVRAAHKFKSSAATLGALHLAELLSSLERDAPSLSLAALQSAAARILAEGDNAIQAVRDFLSRPA